MTRLSSMPSQELLDDLCSRFVLNVPSEELLSFERLLFLVEQAHWFYEDHVRDASPHLKSFTLRDFTVLLFSRCHTLQRYTASVHDIYNAFTSYKVKVPTAGVIILNKTLQKCILVKGWKGGSWGFPRGKKNKDEDDHKCAIREVQEEVGIDVTRISDPRDFFEVTMGEQRNRLYVVSGVEETTPFEAKTKNEISEIAWHYVDHLPLADASSPPLAAGRGLNGVKYYMVQPFVRNLRDWIQKRRLRLSLQLPAVPQPLSPDAIQVVWKSSQQQQQPTSTTSSPSSSSASSIAGPAASHPLPQHSIFTSPPFLPPPVFLTSSASSTATPPSIPNITRSPAPPLISLAPSSNQPNAATSARLLLQHSLPSASPPAYNTPAALHPGSLKEQPSAAAGQQIGVPSLPRLADFRFDYGPIFAALEFRS